MACEQTFIVRTRRFVRDRLYADGEGIVSRVLLAPLALLGELYFLGTRARRALYGSGLLKRTRVNARVIGIGNLTIGGSGKTTLSMELAEYLVREGCRVAVLSRGYRARRRTKDALVVVPEEGTAEDAARAGDEACMIARCLGGAVTVVSGKNRVEAARRAIDEFGAHVLILDDAFQYLRIVKDLELLLVHESDLSGKIRPLPRGPFREPLSSGRWADAIVLVRLCSSRGGASCEARLAPLGKKVFEARPKEVLFTWIWPRQRAAAARDLEGKRILAFASIARVAGFRDILESLHPSWACLLEFPDHHHYDRRELLDLRERARETGALILTTEKDRVKVDWSLFDGVQCYTAFPRYGIFDGDTELRRIVDNIAVRGNR